MQLLAFGLNHTTAPVSVRERAAMVTDGLEDAVQDLARNRGISEATILSTCNRTEIYCRLNAHDSSLVGRWMCRYSGLSPDEIKKSVYGYPDARAVKHAFRVASGLDSMVLGEPQILGQMKNAFAIAHKAGTTGKILNRLFQHTFSVAKQVRTDTAVGANAVSVAYAAVDLARRIFSNLAEQTVLLIGAGETIELVARHLLEQGVRHIIVANRSIERAESLATRIHSEAISLAEMPQRLHEADIVVASTASTLPILGKGTMERATRKRRHKPVFMVDLAVPRDIEPEVGDLRDVYLYTVDDLSEVVEDNMNARREAASEAEKIIDLQVVRFMRWMSSLDSVPTIRTFRQHIDDMREAELQRALKKLEAGADPGETLKRFARDLGHKFAHGPSHMLRKADESGNAHLISATRALFDLKDK
ncbi:MAG: glutamyl-tRNA reductase [marine bacterium B5-7]|nr:MAG: glutamyl-tRNA reductase [marine bacterium B5-7]